MFGHGTWTDPRDEFGTMSGEKETVKDSTYFTASEPTIERWRLPG